RASAACACGCASGWRPAKAWGDDAALARARPVLGVRRQQHVLVSPRMAAAVRAASALRGHTAEPVRALASPTRARGPGGPGLARRRDRPAALRLLQYAAARGTAARRGGAAPRTEGVLHRQRIQADARENGVLRRGGRRPAGVAELVGGRPRAL